MTSKMFPVYRANFRTSSSDMMLLCKLYYSLCDVTHAYKMETLTFGQEDIQKLHNIIYLFINIKLYTRSTEKGNDTLRRR